MNDPNLDMQLRALLSQVSRQDLKCTGLDEDLVLELGLDSLAALRLLAAVEKHFGVRFPDECLAEFRTLRHLHNFIAQERKEPGP
jgi:acyl carrier protein